MEKISFDSGIKSYKINGNGVLRFNPGDPNLYARFLNAVETVSVMEKELQAQAAALPAGDPASAIRLMAETDTRLKTLLTQVFGEGNDFHKVLGGVSLLVNGETITLTAKATALDITLGVIPAILFFLLIIGGAIGGALGAMIGMGLTILIKTRKKTIHKVLISVGVSLAILAVGIPLLIVMIMAQV